MIKKLIFAVGAGVGYVLGTRAGREKYNAMVAKAHKLADRPDVREVTEAVKSEANRLYDEGRQRVRARIEPPQLSDRADARHDSSPVQPVMGDAGRVSQN